MIINAPYDHSNSHVPVPANNLMMDQQTLSLPPMAVAHPPPMLVVDPRHAPFHPIPLPLPPMATIPLPPQAIIQNVPLNNGLDVLALGQSTAANNEDVSNKR